LNTELQGVITKLENRQGTWTESDYSRDVLSGVYSSLPGSSAYTETFLSIERELYKKGGFYETTDLSNKFHLDVERRMKKFSEYAVDGGAYTYMDGGTVEVGNIDLDNLNAKPAAPSATITNQWEDSAYRGWYMLKYNDYVLDRVMGDPSNLVDNFDVWAANNTIAQKEITDMAPYEHDVASAPIMTNKTKLEEAVAKAMSEMLSEIIADNSTDLNIAAVNSILYEPFKAGMNEANVGFLIPYNSIILSYNYSRLRDFADTIKSFNRKTQEKLIHEKAKEVLLYEMDKHPTKYFKPGVDWKTKIKRWWRKYI